MRHRTQTRRVRPRRDEAGPTRAAVRVVVVVGLLAAFGTFALRATEGVPGADHYELQARMPDVGSLRAEDEVRVAGVRVGKVAGTRLLHGQVLVTLRLETGVRPLPADTQAVVRAKGALGARFLELRPGRSGRPLQEGATIAPAQTSLMEAVPDVLQTFDPRTRRAFAAIVDEMGRGLLARARGLNETIHRAPRLTRDLEAVSRAVLDRPEAARRLFPSLAGGVAAWDDAREDLARTLRPAARALQPFADRREALRAALDEAPATLAAAEPAFTEGRALVRATEDLAHASRRTLDGGPVALRRTSSMLRAAVGPLRRTEELVAEARRTMPPALELLESADPVLEPLGRAFGDLGEFLGAAGPYACNLPLFAQRALGVFGSGSRTDPAGPAGPPTDWRFTLSRTHPTGALPDVVMKREAYPATCQEAGR